MSAELVDLILAEREHASLWWGVLNHMRINGEMPDWVRAKGAGSDADHDQSLIERRAVSRAMFGTDDLQAGDGASPCAPDQSILVDLFEVQRDRYLDWWTLLNEMRARKQLPGWVLAQSLGNGPDHDRWTEKTAETNQAIFGRRRVRHSATPPPTETIYPLKG
ncbi:hypothetical protein [Pseudomonas bijieensis]|uniref:hypothetical protein n=1 Tax=Pseudomonas bijieensis TaxID=2681983 RepID=UPI001E5FC4DA|nr:hypothetical protein [Pseudomonas bijieensis]MCD9117643.1 hypothetical protein [Pseudomonas bijieensis]